MGYERSALESSLTLTLIGVAKSATPGSCAKWWVRVWAKRLPGITLASWLEALSRKEVGCQ